MAITTAIERTALGALAWLLVVAGPAAAKMPPYEATVEVDGSVATITVVFLDYDMGVEELEGVFGLYPAEVTTAGPPPLGSEFTPILLTRVADFTYEGSVTVPGPGGWAIVPFPGSGIVPAEMYPTLAFTVSDSGSGDVTEAAVTAGEPTPASTAVGHELQASTGEAELSVTRLPFTGEPSRGNSPDLGLLAGVLGVGVVALVAVWVLRHRRQLSVP